MKAQVFQCGGVLVYQLLCGGEGAIALDNRFAESMRNYCYLIVNSLDRTAVALDAAWDVPGIYKLAEQLGVRIRGSIYTHRHFDHVGGDVPASITQGRKLPPLSGAKDVETCGGQIWAGAADAAEIAEQCALTNEVHALNDGDVIDCGDLVLHVLNTPGHTPGSICIFAAPACLSPRGELGRSPLDEILHKADGGLLLTGDTLFVGSCGATHFSGGDQTEMSRSLARLSTLDPSVVVCPGHAYSDPFTTIGQERQQNQMMRGGMASVPKPLPLPPCVACGSGGRCGPKGFVIGRKVRIAALVSEAGAALNGQEAVVQFFEPKKERYAVRVLGSSEDRLLRPDNLEPPSVCGGAPAPSTVA